MHEARGHFAQSRQLRGLNQLRLSVVTLRDIREDGNESAMRDVLENQGVDLVILDLMMPGEDGLTLTDYLRKRSDVGIIILTGKPDSVDQIVGLELGADDYLSKPCDLRQMLARVRSVLRRRQVAAEAEAAESKQLSGDAVMAFEGFTIHTHRRHLSDPGGEDIPLTTAEYDLLLAFVENAGRALTRDIFLDITRSRELSPFDRSINILVSRLRKKLEAAGSHQDHPRHRLHVYISGDEDLRCDPTGAEISRLSSVVT